jgi:GH15 family glucan-1,4-alpha-glucosidase
MRTWEGCRPGWPISWPRRGRERQPRPALSSLDLGIIGNCTFWYIDALIAQERIAEARELFENMLACRNHLGLLSEDINPENKELWGNFPQTYSLVGLINCAMKLSRTWEDVV